MGEYPDHLAIASKLLDQQEEINRLGAQVAKVRDIHREFKIYEICGCKDHDVAETVELSDGEVVCRKGYMYSVCRECCAPCDSQSEACVDGHDHTEGWKCSTRKAVDEPVEEVAVRG